MSMDMSMDMKKEWITEMNHNIWREYKHMEASKHMGGYEHMCGVQMSPMSDTPMPASNVCTDASN